MPLLSRLLTLLGIVTMPLCVGKVSVTSIFFFSSRRRHTRLQGDWSSDVCSSDLKRPIAIVVIQKTGRAFEDARDAVVVLAKLVVAAFEFASGSIIDKAAKEQVE